ATTSPRWRSCSPRRSVRARPRRRCWVPAPSLRELQGAFWRSIAREPGAAPVPDRLLLETVPPTPTLAPAERVHVYAGMYLWRLVDALREDWPGLRFTLVPACARLVTRWPVHRLWDDAAAPLAPARTALRVWREGFLVYHTAMDPAEEAALDRLVAGAPFAAVCEGFDDPA